MGSDIAPIRILRVISRLNIGGPARHVSTLCARLDRSRFASLLVSGVVMPYEGDMSYIAKELGVEVETIPTLRREVSLMDDVRSFFRLRKIIAEFRPHVVHTHASKGGALGRLAACLAGVPVVVHTFHGHVFRGYFGGAATSFLIRLERSLARRSTAIVVLSDSQRDEIVEEFRIAPAEKVRVIPLGLDLDPFLDARRNPGTLRKRLGIDAEAPLVATVGRLVAIKNHGSFLRAARTILDEKPEVRFVVVGDGEERPGLESLCEELGISHAVTFTGWVRDMCEVYPDTDVLALSSVNEGTPVSVIEAMASGCCVVAARAGGTVDVVRDGEDGLTVPVGDDGALAASILRVLGDADLRHRLGEAARESAKRYGADRLVADMEELYTELVEAVEARLHAALKK
jgi:glycosyltransferase involved in cell wall biosynthesis